MKPYLEIECNEKGAFNCDITFEISKGSCDICKEEKIILCSGAGAGEYGTADICLDCITSAINKFIKEKHNGNR